MNKKSMEGQKKIQKMHGIAIEQIHTLMDERGIIWDEEEINIFILIFGSYLKKMML